MGQLGCWAVVLVRGPRRVGWFRVVLARHYGLRMKPIPAQRRARARPGSKKSCWAHARVGQKNRAMGWPMGLVLNGHLYAGLWVLLRTDDELRESPTETHYRKTKCRMLLCLSWVFYRGTAKPLVRFPTDAQQTHKYLPCVFLRTHDNPCSLTSTSCTRPLLLLTDVNLCRAPSHDKDILFVVRLDQVHDKHVPLSCVLCWHTTKDF
jgi:hypothetical protein